MEGVVAAVVVVVVEVGATGIPRWVVTAAAVVEVVVMVRRFTCNLPLFTVSLSLVFSILTFAVLFLLFRG